MIIADDGYVTREKEALYDELRNEGHTVLQCAFDSGFGHKSNMIMSWLNTPYLLVSCDDFDHDDPAVRTGVEKMVDTLDTHSELDIVSGRLKNRGPYEFTLTERQSGEWYERPLPDSDYFRSIVSCDITVNYSLIRYSVFDAGIHWDEEEVIGEGGHGTFFLDVKQAGFKVAYLPGVEIAEQNTPDSAEYISYRRRACGSSRACFKKRGIKKYVLGCGAIDYEVK
jgi:hypothetical protein